MLHEIFPIAGDTRHFSRTQRTGLDVRRVALIGTLVKRAPTRIDHIAVGSAWEPRRLIAKRLGLSWFGKHTTANAEYV